MSGRRNIIGFLLIAATFILMEVAAIAMLRRSSELQDVFLNRISHRCLGALWGCKERISDYFSLKEANEILAQKNIEIMARNLRLEEIVRSYMSDSVTTVPTVGFSHINAMVVKMSSSSQHNYFVLDKGILDGVETHCGVITPDGVIGIVEAVSDHYCYGLSLLNTNISISARLGRSGDIGPLIWDGRHKNEAILSELALHTVIHPGDTVWTSGYSSLFPPDIPIGIAGEARIFNGTSTEVPVRLFQNYNSVRFVTIIKNIGADEITKLESGEASLNE